jgi:NAD+ synthase (glutamine-hydrolysing)
MEKDMSMLVFLVMNYAEAAVRGTVHLIRQNEYKRRQAPPGIRVTPRGFGKDWRYPITSRYQDEF